MHRALPLVIIYLLMCAAAGYRAGALSGRLDRERDAGVDAAMRRDHLRQNLSAGGRYSAFIAAERLAHWVALPRSPLEAMATGVAPTQVNARRLTLDPAEYWPAEPGENALFLRVTHLDPAVVVLMFLPMVILFGPRWPFGWLVGIVVTGALLAWAGALPAWGSVEGWWRFALWTATAVLSAWFWRCVRAWCDQRPDPERVALAAYAILVVALPALTSMLVSTLFPPPSAARAAAELRAATAARSRADSEKLAPFHEAHPDYIEGADTAAYDRIRLETLSWWRDKASPILHGFEVERARHLLANDTLRLLSPVSAAQGALLEAAGTSGNRAEGFRQQVEAFIAGPWNRFFSDRAQSPQGFTAGDVALVPAFRAEPESALSVLMRMGLPLAALGAFGWLFLRGRPTPQS